MTTTTEHTPILPTALRIGPETGGNTAASFTALASDASSRIVTQLRGTESR
ncbi:hypothetical protein V6U90_28775 [Micromonospora sp. CPCC 206060]|uniref:hypothetical protein n=1 Tax=Micromonospora sp. CPCC 206060 TaxID=3122406 RepID=UPI002FEEEA72